MSGSRVIGGSRPLALVVLVLAATALLTANPALAKPPSEVGHVVKMDISPPLRSIPPAKAVRGRSGLLREGPGEFSDSLTPDGFAPDGITSYGTAPDPTRQASPASSVAPPAMLTDWDGVANADNSFIVSPKAPDSEGDAGLNDYVQWVNLKFKIWSKSGEALYGPANGNTLWQGLGGPCEDYNWGDPQVVFDRIADRWVFMQFAFPISGTTPVAPFYLCFAVSKTPDPTGSYYRYAFHVNASTDYFPDYPKLGVWPDGYYVTTNNIGGSARKGAGVFAFDRSKMLVGDPGASYIEYQENPAFTYLLPASFTGSTLPPNAAPEYFGAVEPPHCGFTCSPGSMFGYRLWLWRFHADFAVPSNSSFSGPTQLTVATYNSLCSERSCIPQPGTTQKVDAPSDHVLQRLEYRSFGAYASLVAAQTVNAGGEVAGMRWYEIQASPPGGSLSVTEDSTYAPDDGINRWMGSAAMDGIGNIALGYSMSNGSTVHPSVGITGSANGSGTMGLGETTMIAGGGSQTGSDRWGDYSAMSIDPSDDQTFWYTQQYYSATSPIGWRTRVGSFRLVQGPSATLTQLNGRSIAFPYVTRQNVSSIAGGCTIGEGMIAWSVSGAASRTGSASCASGTWTVSLGPPLSSDGSYTLSAAQGAASSPSQTLTIDSTAPEPPVLTALPPYIRNGQSLTATSVSDNGGGSGVRQVNYLYCQGSSCTPETPIGSSATASGNYAVSWDGQPAGGTYRVMAQTEDKAGNTADSPIRSTVVDNTAPLIALDEVNGGAAAFPYATDQSVSSIGGSCGTASGDVATVSWSVSGAASTGGDAPCSGGAWDATVSLFADGVYTLSAAQSDEAGNADSSGGKALTIDSTVPEPPTLSPLPPHIRNGRSLTAANVSDNGGGSGVQQVSYLYCPGSSCTPDMPIGSSSTADGDYAVNWSGQPADGAYRVMARTEDKAGNTADSPIRSTVIDNTPPSVTLNELNGDTVAFPYETDQSVTSVGGSCGTASGDAANVSWSVSGAASTGGDAPCSGGAWDATVSLFADGVYTLSAAQSDEAGNADSSGGKALAIANATAPPNPAPKAPERRLSLGLRVGRESLQRLLRTSRLLVALRVNGAARVALVGRAKRRVRARRGARTKLVAVFGKRRVSLAGAGRKRLTLVLSRRGRRILRGLRRVRLVILGGAADATGDTTRRRLTLTLWRRTPSSRRRGHRRHGPRASAQVPSWLRAVLREAGLHVVARG